jgi:hypothetical protein
LSTRLVAVDPEVMTLAVASHDESAHRQGEPYRQALTGIYARLAGIYTELTGSAPVREAHSVMPPYTEHGKLAAELSTLSRSLHRNGSACWPRPGSIRDSRRRSVRLSPPRSTAPEQRRARETVGELRDAGSVTATSLWRQRRRRLPASSGLHVCSRRHRRLQRADADRARRIREAAAARARLGPQASRTRSSRS